MFNKIIMKIDECRAVYHILMLFAYRYLYDGNCTRTKEMLANNPKRFRCICCGRMQYHYGKYSYIVNKLGERIESIEELDMIYIDEMRAFYRELMP